MLVAVVIFSAGCGKNADRGPVEQQQRSDRANWSSAEWTLVAAEGRKLTIRYSGGGCVGSRPGYVPLRRVVRERSDLVRIGIYLRTNNPCAGVITGGKTVVWLDRPLGDRKLARLP